MLRHSNQSTLSEACADRTSCAVQAHPHFQNPPPKPAAPPSWSGFRPSPFLFSMAYFMRDLSLPPADTPCIEKSQFSHTDSHGFLWRASSFYASNWASRLALFCFLNDICPSRSFFQSITALVPAIFLSSFYLSSSTMRSCNSLFNYSCLSAAAATIYCSSSVKSSSSGLDPAAPMAPIGYWGAIAGNCGAESAG